MGNKIVRYFLICLISAILVLTVNRIREFTEVKVMKYPTAGPSKNALLDAISRHKNGEIPTVDLSTITTFTWDRLYVFGPYTQPSEIAAVVGRSWQDSCFTTIASTDGLALLVFTNNGQAVGCIEFPRNVADFVYLDDYETGFSVEKARFIVDERGQTIWMGNK